LFEAARGVVLWAHLQTTCSHAVGVAHAVAPRVSLGAPRAADHLPKPIELGVAFYASIFPTRARVDLLRNDITRLACATATFAGAEQIDPIDSELPVRNAEVSFRQGIDTLACFGVAFCASIFSVPTIQRFIHTARTIGAAVAGAQVAIIAIEFFADDADPVRRTAAVVSFAPARVAPARHVADARFVVAVVRALIAVIHATGTRVLSAHAADADVTRTATRTAGGSIADWVVVTLITGRAATKNIEPNKDTFVYGAWVAVTAIPARTRGPAPHHRHDAQRKR
jgi:hypothetical protein